MKTTLKIVTIKLHIISLHQIQYLLQNIMKKNKVPTNYLMPDVLYQPHDHSILTL